MRRVKMVNTATGTEMLVAEDRVKEYLKTGHKKAETKGKVNRPETKTRRAEEAAAEKAKPKEKK